jgi:dTDP-glucose 4,6-dehydratase
VENVTLTHRILALLGKPTSLITPVTDRPGHDRRYALDSTKIGRLGWTPASTFDTALAATVEWYRTHEAWWTPIKSGAFRQYYQSQYAARA